VGNWQTVAGFQIREILVRKVLWLLIGTATLSLVLFGFAIHMVTAEAGVPKAITAQVLEQFLTMMLILSCLLTNVVATFAVAGTVGLELESGRIQMVVSRPVRRSSVFLGQYVGLAVVVGGFASLYYVAILLVFGSFSHVWPPGWTAGVLVFPISALIQVSLSIWLCSYLSSMAAGVVGLVLVLFSWIGALLELIGHLARLSAVELTGVIMSMLLPASTMNSWVTGHLRDSLHELVPVPFGLSMGPNPSTGMIIYGLCYLGAVLMAGVFAFRHREL
jgi:ABC-type transport system involved in multi-copper enzyme maturation permease subunit